MTKSNKDNLNADILQKSFRECFPKVKGEESTGVRSDLRLLIQSKIINPSVFPIHEFGFFFSELCLPSEKSHIILRICYTKIVLR